MDKKLFKVWDRSRQNKFFVSIDHSLEMDIYSQLLLNGKINLSIHMHWRAKRKMRDKNEI